MLEPQVAPSQIARLLPARYAPNCTWLWPVPPLGVLRPNIRYVEVTSTVTATEPLPHRICWMEMALASQVLAAPPVFWMELPVAVTLTRLVKVAEAQTVGIGVGDEVAVNVGVGVTVGIVVNFCPQILTPVS